MPSCDTGSSQLEVADFRSSAHSSAFASQCSTRDDSEVVKTYLPLEIGEVREILQPAVLLLLNLPDQGLDVVSVLMFLLAVALLFLVNTVLAVPLHTLDGLMRLNDVVGDGTVEIVPMDGRGGIN